MQYAPEETERTLNALGSIARAVADTPTVETVAARAVQAIVDTGIAQGAFLEAPGTPPIRHMAGETSCLLASHNNGKSIPATPYYHTAGVPSRSAPGTCLAFSTSMDVPPALIEVLTEILASAMDRAASSTKAKHLHNQIEQRSQEVTAIYDIGKAIGSDEYQAFLDLITAKASRVMDASACSLMRLNRETQKLTIAASYGLSDDIVVFTQQAVGEGIAGRVAQTGEPLLICSGQPELRGLGLSLRADLGSAMIVPMCDEAGRMMGVLCIRRLQPAPDFTNSDLQLFTVFASQAGLAISNQQLYADLRRRVQQLSTLSDMTQAVISTLDIQSLLNNVADHIVKLVNFDRCAIFMEDRSTKHLVPRVLRGYRLEAVTRAPLHVGEGVLGLVARKQMPIVADDARNALQPIRGFARSLGTNSFVAIPIIAKGQAIGVVLADNRKTRRPIPTESVEVLTAFVSQAGLLLENAQLYDDRERRFQETNRLATETDNILRSIAAAVIVIDAEWHVTRWNQAAEALWGIRESDAAGHRWSDMLASLRLPESECHQLTDRMRQVQEEGEIYQGYKTSLHPEGRPEIQMNLLISPLTDRTGERQGLVLILEDLTREANMEAEIARIRRLADIGQLAAKMAHEVRNPLSSIKGAAQLMRNEYDDQPRLREFLDIIVDEVNSLSKLTTDLLDFARPMNMDLRETDLNALIERSVSLLQPEIEAADVRVHTDTAENLPQVACDAKQIEQVVRNLVINAIQAMPTGGDLNIETRADSGAETVTIRVRDSGTGIRPEQLDDIFQPFVTSKTKGSGLGLSIVEKIVENHGGSIEASSEWGSGACFSITLPCKPASQATDIPHTPQGHMTLPDG